ncbi:glycosyltransferase [Streptomyces sp. ISL-90]|nr:glycosyltransferase [Streptomyces sp. ISL-90]
MPESRTRVAIAHDYLTQRGGAEKVVLAMARAFPDAPIYTTLYEPSGTFPEFASLDVRPSALNAVGPLRRNHRGALLALPFVSNSITIDADIVLTSSSGWAHGFRTNGQKLVYCYSPARWLYQSDVYLGDRGGVKRAIIATAGPALRAWDRRAAASAARYLAISSAVQDRILNAYGITASVLSAPHSIDTTQPEEPVLGVGEDFYLCISRLLPYKNVDRIIEAVSETPERRLVIVGSGPEEARLAHRLPRNVTMLKDLTDGQLHWLYRRCRAIVAASYEDFGLTPIEGAAFGKPSAVLRWGGFLDTVIEGTTGVFFDEPTPGAIRDALDRIEVTDWHRESILAATDRFSEARFHEALRDAIAAMAPRAPMVMQ